MFSRHYTNDNQTDSAPRTVSVTTTIEMKTGEMIYETQNSKEKDEANH